jgi:hypothetical protein
LLVACFEGNGTDQRDVVVLMAVLLVGFDGRGWVGFVVFGRTWLNFEVVFKCGQMCCCGKFGFVVCLTRFFFMLLKMLD